MKDRNVSILACLLFTLLALPMAGAEVVVTDFDDGTPQGWTGEGVRPPGLAIDTPGPSGFAGDRFLSATDTASVGGIPGLRMFAAPQFLGDLTGVARTCGALELDLRVLEDQGGELFLRIRFENDADGFGQGQAPQIAAVFRGAQPIDESDGWVRVVVPLHLIEPGDDLPSNSSGFWEMFPGHSPAQWNALLADVDVIHIPLEINGGTFERIGIDNVRLVTAECPCGTGPPDHVVRGGLRDDFASPSDPADPRPALQALIPGGVSVGFDHPFADMQVAHTLRGLPAKLQFFPSTIVRAEIETRMRPLTSLPGNDGLALGVDADGTFSFSTMIESLPEAQGSWSTGDSAAVFRLDLGELPDGTNLLPKLDAERLLDFRVQDDTTVDYVQLEVWTCPRPVRVEGFAHDSYGNYAVSASLRGDLLLTAADGPGEGGVVIDHGLGDGFRLSLSPLPQVSDAAEGAGYALVSTFETVEGGEVDSSLSFELVGDDVDVTADFTALQTAVRRIEIFRDGVRLADFLHDGNGPDMQLLSQADDGCSDDGCSDDGGGDGGGGDSCGPVIIFSGNLPGTLAPADGTLVVITVGDTCPMEILTPHQGPFIGDRVVITALDAQVPVTGVRRQRIHISGLDEVVLGDQALRFGDLLYAGRGTAITSPSRGALLFGQLDDSGESGLIADLPDVESVDLDFAPLDVGEPLPVGAFIEVGALGRFEGVPDQSLGSVRIEKTGENEGLLVSADFAEVGSPTQRIQVLSGGQLVVDLPGHLGPVGRSSNWPIGLGKLFPLDRTKCIRGDFPSSTLFSIDGVDYAGDELRVLADGADGTVGTISELSLRTSGIPEITLTGAETIEASCIPDANTHCLADSRFQVSVTWQDFQGNTGVGQALPLTADTGMFWFFHPANIELVVKVLDARTVNGHFWVFYGALSNVAYTIEVVDTATGAVRTYENPSGVFASLGDTTAFAGDGAGGTSVVRGEDLIAGSGGAGASRGMVQIQGDAVGAAPFDSAASLERIAGAQGTCAPDATSFCLHGARFRISSEWATTFGTSGVGQAIPLTSDTGAFWFFDQANVELVVKIIDGRTVNGNWWVFYGSLSNVEFTVTVEDTERGRVLNLFNPQGNFGSRGETELLDAP